jgi:hypothetical protein
MDERAQRHLLGQLKDARGGVRLRYGTVTSDDPLTITVGGAADEFVGVKTLETGLGVGHSIAILTQGNDLLVLGVVRTNDPDDG